MEYKGEGEVKDKGKGNMDEGYIESMTCIVDLINHNHE